MYFLPILLDHYEKSSLISQTKINKLLRNTTTAIHPFTDASCFIEPNRLSLDDNHSSSDSKNEPENDSKINRKISRRASIVNAAATARQKWEQMKNAAPAVNRMSLKSKRKSREENKITIDEKDTITNVGDNNNDVDVEKSKKSLVTTNESS